MSDDAKHVRVVYEIFTATAGAAGEQTRDVYLTDDGDPYWVTLDDRETIPYRIPRKCIKSIKPLG